MSQDQSVEEYKNNGINNSHSQSFDSNSSLNSQPQQKKQKFLITEPKDQQQTKQQEPTANQYTGLMKKVGILTNELNHKVGNAMHKQEMQFMNSFKVVMKQVQRELVQLKDNFQKQNSKNAKEEQMQYLNDQLEMFKHEFWAMYEENLELKKKIVNLNKREEVLKSDVKFEHNVLVKNEKIQRTLKQQIAEISDQNMMLTQDIARFKKQEDQIKTFRSTIGQFKEDQIIFDDISKIIFSDDEIPEKINQIYKIQSDLQKKFQGQVSSIQSQFKYLNQKYREAMSQIEQQQKSFQEQSILQEIFKNCVEEQFREIQHRKIIQSNGFHGTKMSKKEDFIDYQMGEYQNDIFDLTKENTTLIKYDKLQIMEKFFTSAKFMQAIENQIYGKKCCYHDDCLNNQNDQNSDAQPRVKMDAERKIDVLLDLSSRLNTQSHLKIQQQNFPQLRAQTPNRVESVQSKRSVSTGNQQKQKATQDLNLNKIVEDNPFTIKGFYSNKQSVYDNVNQQKQDALKEFEKKISKFIKYNPVQYKDIQKIAQQQFKEKTIKNLTQSQNQRDKIKLKS